VSDLRFSFPDTTADTSPNGATSGVSVSVQAFHRERANVSFDVISPRWDHSSIGTEVESGYPYCA